MYIFLFASGIILLTVFSIIFPIALALWTYEDAKVRSEGDVAPILWVLFSVLVCPIGTIVYLVVRKKGVQSPGKFKKLMIASIVGFIFSLGLFTFGTIYFVIEVESSGYSIVTVGSYHGSEDYYSGNVWDFTARSANGYVRRSPTLNARQLANFHVISENTDGIVILAIEQEGTLQSIDISGYYNGSVDMSAFVPGRVRVTLQFDGARNVDSVISWRD
ncbi:MAG: hypothetical protein LBI27_08225 [Clostridiales bacterium]|jgi:hypothetical protein|nr:hypothetical protein [Clostridiales bacterium]